ncbi:MAG TPA: GNAT family N-acetyltransferase [Trueperaceae bacterium]
MAVRFAPMSPSHWPRVSTIYAEGIATGQATFQTEIPSWEEWDASHLAACRLVLFEDDVTVGWAALSPVSRRYVYRGVAEVSIYVAGNARGRGLGSQLLEALVRGSEEAGVWTLQAGIFPENTASLRLHRSCGFRVVGTRERLGELRGVWRDVLLLERRSAVSGC